MILSRNWLNEFVDLKDITDKQFNDDMTLSGSKVETIERLDESLKNVVAGKILSMEKHPDSDHMWVCQLDVGREEPVQIVTGAWNIHVGDLVPAALHKSVLPGGVKIEKGKLRGVKSNGMMCSIEELGSSRDLYPEAPEYGIYIFGEESGVKPGDDAIAALGLHDSVVEYEITSNRVDCFSMIGMAREAAATFDKEFHEPEIKVQGSGGDVNDYITVDVQAPDLCPRYTARVVTDLKIGPSPKWMP